VRREGQRGGEKEHSEPEKGERLGTQPRRSLSFHDGVQGKGGTGEHPVLSRDQKGKAPSGRRKGGHLQAFMGKTDDAKFGSKRVWGQEGKLKVVDSFVEVKGKHKRKNTARSGAQG